MHTLICNYVTGASVLRKNILDSFVTVWFAVVFGINTHEHNCYHCLYKLQLVCKHYYVVMQVQALL